ncbi:hypothetical protein CUMW_094540 [Citrus unshiu]|uniref:LysM domain-containing protein n=1 Tax=Citrus unshiu TaxID=55188 RepID=A0A2H5P174_CITUN|nr:hypothetical protein CUMW_094540 [Citrus unshiu]
MAPSLQFYLPNFIANRVSNKVPVYTVKKDDGLDFIARTIFGQLLKYQKIVEANNISNPDLIQIGQNLTIPLPCSCDDVDNAKVVHYAHVVEEGSSFVLIAQKFGTDRDTLMKLNGIHDDSKLIAGEPLDVPLKACNSSIRADSFDNYLRVANGTYTFTANSCVKCQCDATNNWTLQCEPSQFQPSSPNSRWKTCPSMLCGDSESLSIGNTTTSNNCNRTTCEYAGYNNLSILTTLNSLSTCPSPSNNASRIGSWNLLLISIFLVLLHFHLIQ